MLWPLRSELRNYIQQLWKLCAHMLVKCRWMTMTMKIRTFSELNRIDSFEDRYEYLRLKGEVGNATFGFDRYLNQAFYKSFELRNARRLVITRDRGCDLGVEGFEVHSQILIHHMNPIDEDGIRLRDPDFWNPEYLITTTHRTHNAIHYGDEKLLQKPLIPRK